MKIENKGHDVIIHVPSSRIIRYGDATRTAAAFGLMFFSTYIVAVPLLSFLLLEFMEYEECTYVMCDMARIVVEWCPRLCAAFLCGYLGIVCLYVGLVKAGLFHAG